MAVRKTVPSKEVALAQASLPGKLGESMQLATILSKSGVVPASYAGKPEAIFAIVQYGKELGIPPMVALQNMSFINGKPSMGSDLLGGLANKHPEWGGYEITKLTDEECSLKVFRTFAKSGKTVAFPGSFSMDDARKAGLVRSDGPWVKWRRRMLKHRAFAFALRDAFPDAFMGLYTVEEMDPDGAAQEEYVMAVNDDDLHVEAIKESGAEKDAPKIAPKKAVKK